MKEKETRRIRRNDELEAIIKGENIVRFINPLTPNNSYSGRIAPITSNRCILYIYSTNIVTEYFKHGTYSPFFCSSKCIFFHNSNVFGSCIIHILYTGCAKIKKKYFRYQKVKGLRIRWLGHIERMQDTAIQKKMYGKLYATRRRGISKNEMVG